MGYRKDTGTGSNNIDKTGYSKLTKENPTNKSMKKAERATGCKRKHFLSKLWEQETTKQNGRMFKMCVSQRIEEELAAEIYLDCKLAGTRLRWNPGILIRLSQNS